MANLPIKFRKSPEAVVSFDFVDTLRGQAYIDFFAGGTTPQEETEQAVYDENDDATITVTNNTDRMCQTFTLTSETWISSVEINVGDNSANPFLVSLEETTSGEPNGNVLAVNNDLGVTSTTPEFKLWTLDSPIKVSAGTYAIVINGLGNGISIGDNDDRFWRVDESSPTFTGGSIGLSTDSGDSWSMDTSKDAMFRVLGFTSNPYLLFTNAFETKYNTHEILAPTGLISTDTKIGEMAFDLKIGVNMTIEGEAICEIEWILKSVMSGDGDLNGSIKVIINKYDGTTETEIGSTKSIIRKQINPGNNTFDTRETLKIDCTKTSINRGDFLRITVESYISDHNELGSANNEFGASVSITFDPEDESNKNDLKMQIPFKIDN